MKKLRSKLKEISQQSRSHLTKHVVDYALEIYYSDEEIENFFKDLLNHGCVCGMISGLIYYSETHAFYDKFYYEIEELRQEMEFSMSEPLPIKNNDLKNFLAWFGFEETARLIADKIGLEI